MSKHNRCRCSVCLKHTTYDKVYKDIIRKGNVCFECFDKYKKELKTAKLLANLYKKLGYSKKELRKPLKPLKSKKRVVCYVCGKAKAINKVDELKSKHAYATVCKDARKCKSKKNISYKNNFYKIDEIIDEINALKIGSLSIFNLL